MIFHSYVSLPEGILYVVNLKQDRKVFHDCNVLSFLLLLFLYIYNHAEVWKVQRTPANGNDIEICSIYLRITIDLPSGSIKTIPHLWTLPRLP